jgi:tetratricopeptide (TPR) repeat protein
MQAQMTEQPTLGATRSVFRRLFSLLILLGLIALAVYGYNAGWFRQAGAKLSDYYATSANWVEQKFGTGSDASTSPKSAIEHAGGIPANTASPGMSATGDMPANVGMPSNAGMGPSDRNMEADNNPGNANIPPFARAVGDEDTLSFARGAFAAGDINAAVENYRGLIARNPDNVAAYGELGNVLYTIGNLPAAAQAFFAAASKAIEQNQLAIAESLLPAVIEGNPMLATYLNDQLFHAQARNNASRPWQPMLQPDQPFLPQGMPR